MKRYLFLKSAMLPVAAGLLFNIGVQAQNIDSLENVVKTGTPEMQMETLGKIAKYYQFNDIPKAMEFAMKEKQIAEKEKNQAYRGESMENLGFIYYRRKMIDSALYYFETASVIWKEMDDKAKMADSWLNIGAMQTLLNREDESIENNRKALEYFQLVDDKEKISTALGNIANAYSYMGNIQKSEQYTLQAIDVDEKIGNITGLGISYYNLGTYFETNNKKAIEYGEKAVDAFRKTGNPYFLGMALVRVCKSFINDIDLAPDKNKIAAQKIKISKYLDEASGIAEKIDNENMKYEILSAKTHYELVLGNYKKAKSLSENLMAKTDTTMKTDMQAAYELLIFSTIRNKDSEEAAQYFNKYCLLRNEIAQQKWTENISEMETKYETEKKELQITALQKEKRLMTGLSIAGGAVLLLALTAFFFLWRWTVQKRRLAEKQKQLAEQQVKQLEKEKQLVATQAVLDGETRERARLARDLHDGLGSMMTGAKLNLLEMKKGIKLEFEDVERFNKSVGLLDESIQEMRRVAHHLMPDSLSRFGLRLAVSDFCSTLPSVKFAYYGDESRLDPNLEVLIYRSIHELVNNALKHAGADNIMVQIIHEPDRIAFTVQDDGCGFDPSSGTEGMGLQNIRTRVASYNGMLDFNSKPGEGTEINVELKVES